MLYANPTRLVVGMLHRNNGNRGLVRAQPLDKMDGEVIDLISSPSIGPTIPSPVQYSKRPTPPPATSVPGPFSDDVFDLTEDSPEAINGRRSGDVPNSQQLPPVRQSNSAVSREILFLSDDFDTTGDLDKSLDWVGTAAEQSSSNKRRRLSPAARSQRGPIARSQSAIVASSRPSTQQPRSLHRAQALADPIEFSSSPFATTSGRVQSAVTMDPFVSTPPVPPLAPEQLPPASSLDPFASDPPAAPAKVAPKPSAKPVAIAVIEIDDDDLASDPFASSPRATAAPTSTVAREPNQMVPKPKSPRKPTADWDPISSSAPELHARTGPFDSSPPICKPRKPVRKTPAVISLSDSELSTHEAGPALDSEDEEFPDLAEMDMSRHRTKRAISDILDSPPSKPQRPRPKSKAASLASTANAKLSAEQKARAKETKTAEREAEKERKRLEKEAVKEQKAKEKERAAALAEVNKVRTDKKVSTPEMIIDLPVSLPAALALQAQELLKDLDVEYTTWESPVENVVKWRRKVRSYFNEDLGMWEPAPLRIDKESYALVVVMAADFVSMALNTEGEDLDAHVVKMKSSFPEHQFIYLIDGLNPWMRKNRNVRNRQFVSAVRGQEGDAAPTASGNARRRKNQATQAYIDEDMVEDALLQLQVVHGVQIHHTSAPIETAQWIAVFTQHISTVPYRKQKEAANAAGAGFCMESGQVRTGEDVKDTYTKLLQEIVRVTAPIAYGIAAEYESVAALVKGLEEGGPLALEGCRKSANKDGGLSDRAVGQAVSRRIHKVFTGRDETSTDV